MMCMRVIILTIYSALLRPWFVVVAYIPLAFGMPFRWVFSSQMETVAIAIGATIFRRRCLRVISLIELLYTNVFCAFIPMGHQVHCSFIVLPPQNAKIKAHVRRTSHSLCAPFVTIGPVLVQRSSAKKSAIHANYKHSSNNSVSACGHFSVTNLSNRSFNVSVNS